MRRREFVGLLGAAAKFPFASHAQKPAKMHHVTYIAIASHVAASKCTAAPPFVSTAFLRARTRPTYRSSNRPSLIFPLISKPPTRLASLCRPHCSPALMR
jgi:hypothetical protein